eukprot:4106343-Amphidinium_carterae.1
MRSAPCGIRGFVAPLHVVKTARTSSPRSPSDRYAICAKSRPVSFRCVGSLPLQGLATGAEK